MFVSNHHTMTEQNDFFPVLAATAAILEVSQFYGQQSRGGIASSRRREAIETGEKWTTTVLSDEQFIYDYTRCRLDSFNHLLNFLENTTPPLTSGRRVSSAQKLLLFLHVCATGIHFRIIRGTFQMSLGTVSRSFHEVLKSLVTLHLDEVKQPAPSAGVPRQIVADPKRMPFFRSCIGALDGSHIHCFVGGGDDQAPWRNRKGYLSQNVLAVCDFDGNFTYILAGWEGSAHDGRVLTSTREHGFGKSTPGRYYLADAGYSNSAIAMVPYRDVRYHLREQAAAQQRPKDKKELFNLRHASLRNAIERAFGVLKKRFQIFDHAPQFDIDTQVELVYALTALHNLLNRLQGALDIDDVEHNLDDDEDGEEEVRFEPEGRRRRRLKECEIMAKLRDKLAEDMWKDYQEVLERPQYRRR